MKITATKQELVKFWREKAQSKKDLAMSYSKTKGGKTKREALFASGEAYAYEICAEQLERLLES